LNKEFDESLIETIKKVKKVPQTIIKVKDINQDTHLNPTVLLIAQKEIKGQIFNISVRHYKNSIVLKMTCAQLRIEKLKSISIKTFLLHTGRVHM
jgi:hypothetical protein